MYLKKKPNFRIDLFFGHLINGNDMVEEIRLAEFCMFRDDSRNLLLAYDYMSKGCPRCLSPADMQCRVNYRRKI